MGSDKAIASFTFRKLTDCYYGSIFAFLRQIPTTEIMVFHYCFANTYSRPRKASQMGLSMLMSINLHFVQMTSRRAP